MSIIIIIIKYLVEYFNIQQGIKSFILAYLQINKTQTELFIVIMKNRLFIINNFFFFTYAKKFLMLKKERKRFFMFKKISEKYYLNILLITSRKVWSTIIIIGTEVETRKLALRDSKYL